MKKTLLLFCALISTTLVAQLPRNLLVSTEKITMYDEYEGSIYMKSRYKESSVIDEKSGTFDAKLKYNVYSDALEFTTPSNELFAITQSPTIHARIDGDYFYYCNFKNQRGMNKDGYYILVELNDRYRIYKKLTTDIIDPVAQTSMVKKSTDGEDVGKVKIATTYYLEESGVIMELPMNKKEMLAAFNDKENELEQYLKKEKLRLRKEEDLIRLVARYNALKSSDSGISRSLLSNSGTN
ncbi:hypothetical protein [Aquimarina pacifica]|uniref:hypothetical protein n=1 Tax=Aquimarina pacifica TaxID=1296415 RepID=UPI000470A43C|nr:hypothetical protein [Aquimarina pacifica]